MLLFSVDKFINTPVHKIQHYSLSNHTWVLIDVIGNVFIAKGN